MRIPSGSSEIRPAFQRSGPFPEMESSLGPASKSDQALGQSPISRNLVGRTDRLWRGLVRHERYRRGGGTEKVDVRRYPGRAAQRPRSDELVAVVID